MLYEKLATILYAVIGQAEHSWAAVIRAIVTDYIGNMRETQAYPENHLSFRSHSHYVFV